MPMPDEKSPRDKAAPHSQTLDRGLRLLEVLADAERPLAIAELADALGVHRSIAYRILRTLEDHRLVRRGPDGACELGLGLATLARNVSRDLHVAALPELTAVANEIGMTTFLAVADGDECVTLAAVEPRRSVAVAQRPGSRHSLRSGAPGIALLSAGPARPDERPIVTEARRLGHARSDSEVIAGLSSLAVPVLSAFHGLVGAVAVVHLGGTAADEAAIAVRLHQAARTIAAELA
jgi:DNA-binding IclR family transcriptional regulator